MSVGSQWGRINIGFMEQTACGWQNWLQTRVRGSCCFIWPTLGGDLQSGANLNRATKTTGTGQRHETDPNPMQPPRFDHTCASATVEQRPFPKSRSTGEKRRSPRRKTG
jgi:hypothetical protein